MSPPLRATGAGEGDTLVYALRVIRERVMLILGVTVACGVLALLLALVRAESYEATARVVFGQSQLEDQVLQSSTQSASPERDAATRVLVATSEEVGSRVRRRLATDVPTEELLADVAVEAEPNADVLNFTAQAPDAPRSAALANAFAAEYIAFERSSLLAQIRRAQRDYNDRLRTLQFGTPAYESVRQQLDRLAALKDLGATDSRLISRATPPVSPASPNPRRDLVLGLIVGLLLGVALAFLLDLLDRRVKSLDDFERLYGLRALASVPRTSFVIPTEDLGSPVFEPYRILRTAISFAEARTDTRVILVTSAIASEGKTSVALNLARAFAQSGQPAILLEADLRRPTVAVRLGIDDRNGGLTTALAGRHRARELLHEIPGERGSGALVLPAGPLAPNAPQLLAGSRMASVLEELTAGPEVVIIDAAPLLPVADTQALLDLPHAPSTLLVARVNATKREDAARCRSILEQRDSRLLGLVVTGVDPAEGYDYAHRGDDAARAAQPPQIRAVAR